MFFIAKLYYVTFRGCPLIRYVKYVLIFLLMKILKMVSIFILFSQNVIPPKVVLVPTLHWVVITVKTQWVSSRNLA